MRGRALLPVVALAACAALAASCLSPTLPLPPPDLPEDIGPRLRAVIDERIATLRETKQLLPK